MSSQVNRHSHIIIILLSVLVGAVLAGLALYHPRVHTLASAQAVNVPGSVQALENAFVDVAARTLPAVVSISVETTGEAGNLEDFEKFFRDNPFFEPFFKEFKRDREAKPRRVPRGQSLGSGWICSEDGHIVTNAHVVRGAEKITVRLHDKEGDEREYPAKLVGTDPKTELAVIKVDAGRKLPTLRLGSSADARVGQWVMAVGAPFRLEQTVTVGVISAKGRFLPGQSQYIRIGDIIQTDASINPGNSGGPLVNLAGEVIGINVAIVSTGLTPGNVGIGFAIPADTARHVVQELIEHGQVARGWLGIKIKELTPNLREFYGVNESGVLVEGVDEDGPAAKGGLQAEDVILAIDGQRVRDTWELQKAVAARRPGTEVTLDVIRDRQPVQVKVTLGKMPDKYAGVDQTPVQMEAPQQSSALGIKVEDLTAETRQRLGLKDAKGVLVVSVDPDGPAAQKLERGDVIFQVNRTRIASVKEFHAALEAARKEGKSYVVIGFQRKVDDEWLSSREDIEVNW